MINIGKLPKLVMLNPETENRKFTASILLIKNCDIVAVRTWNACWFLNINKIVL